MVDTLGHNHRVDTGVGGEGDEWVGVTGSVVLRVKSFVTARAAVCFHDNVVCGRGLRILSAFSLRHCVRE